MIIYKNIIEKLKDAGYSTYKLTKDKHMSFGTIQRLKTNQPITTETLNIICKLTGLDISDLIEYKED